MKRIITFLSISALFLGIISCNDEKGLETQEKAVAVTGDATEVSTHTAVLSGTANITPGNGEIKVGILYSLEENITSDNSTELFAKELDSHNNYTLTALDLKAGRKYYYCAFVYQGGVWFKGEVRAFNTLAIQLVKEYVDLGLSVNWATCNVGAEKPEDLGDYYAWGETETKNKYNWNTYKWYMSGSPTLAKYDGDNHLSSPLDDEDDVANVLWGGNWKIPTPEQYQELIGNTICEWVAQGDVNGYKITSKIEGYTDKSIFIPAKLDKSGASLYYAYGQYWLNDGWGKGAQTIQIVNRDYNEMGFILSSAERCRSCYVRPVCKSETWKGISRVELNKDTIVALQDYRYLELYADAKIDSVSYNYFPITWKSDNPAVASLSASTWGYDEITGRDVYVILGSEGTATITATCMGVTAKCVVIVKHAVSEYVDLGLSVKWATCNIGASYPEYSGGTFQWGDTTYNYNNGWTENRFCKNGSGTQLTKYCTDSSYGYEGFVDYLTTLQPEDDAAHVMWSAEWRMPTKYEMKELIDNCTWEKIECIKNNIFGYNQSYTYFKVTSNKDGFKGHFILIPIGNYWASTLDDDPNSWMTPSYAASYLLLSSDNSGTYTIGSKSRSQCFYIRPVCP